MDVKLVMFAIEAGAKLGRRIDDVLVDATAARPLLLPLGDLFANVDASRAVRFFDREENLPLVSRGGPYFDLDREGLTAAYLSLLDADQRLDGPGEIRESTAEVIAKLHAFENSKKGTTRAAAAQRVLGTLVEIGIDYFVANPKALGKNSSERRIISAFVQGLDDVDFAEGERAVLLQGVLGAALHTLNGNITLLTDDRKASILLGGVTKALIADIESAGTQAAKGKRQKLFARISGSILLGAADALSGDLDLFLPEDDTAKALVGSTLTQFLDGIRGKENLFSNESLELLFKSALGAAAENAELFSSKPYLQAMIARTVGALTQGRAKDLFSEETVAAILRDALEIFAENIETLVDPEDPQHQLLASALTTMVKKLSKDQAASLKDLFSKRQAVELVSLILDEVAQHPEELLAGIAGEDDDRKTVLAQVVASVAGALSEDFGSLLNGKGVVDLVRIAIEVTVNNADKLIDLESQNPKTNLLYKVLAQVIEAVQSGDDERGLVTRDVLGEILEGVLPVVSANVDELLGEQPKAVQETIAKALELASGKLQNRVNGANLATLIEGLLLDVLWKELNLEESTALEQAALRVLRAA